MRKKQYEEDDKKALQRKKYGNDIESAYFRFQTAFGPRIARKRK